MPLLCCYRFKEYHCRIDSDIPIFCEISRKITGKTGIKHLLFMPVRGII